MFALGRLVANTGDRSDHANMIDHDVVTDLASTIGTDGSPLVRKVRKRLGFLEVLRKVYSVKWGSPQKLWHGKFLQILLNILCTSQVPNTLDWVCKFIEGKEESFL